MSTSVLRDTRTVLHRELRPVLREPVSIFFSLIQPLFFLAGRDRGRRGRGDRPRRSASRWASARCAALRHRTAFAE